ncbi:MAG: tRNA dihydrouridine synthase DusB [Ignavibacteria bacterium]|nr:tRNA dihydrouridine synthase DusB [Ignavibacteria bacterium]
MKIGSINIDRPVVLAPMEDVTDRSFRLICKRLGADMLYTEFVNAEGLVRQSDKTRRKMLFDDDERPFGIQLYGGVDTSMEGAARMAEELHPDLIDINCGCWVKNVAMRGAGAGLLRDLPRLEQLVSTVVKSVSLPVTVKTRLGWDAESIKIVEVAKMLEQTGIRGLTIHCRTRAQGHKGEPDFSWIPEIKRHVSIPIIANGSLETPEQIQRVFSETGCDGVMIGRAAIDNPWIFEQTKMYRATGSYAPVSVDQRIELMLTHLGLAVQHKGERKGIIEFRKHYSGYLKGIPNSASLRSELMQYTLHTPIVEKIQRFHERLASDCSAPPMVRPVNENG